MTRDEIIEMAREATKEAPREEWNTTAWVFGEETLEYFADQILEEVAQEIAKLPFGDTASSFAVFVRQMKVNRSDNGQERGRLSASSTPAE